MINYVKETKFSNNISSEGGDSKLLDDNCYNISSKGSDYKFLDDSSYNISSIGGDCMFFDDSCSNISSEVVKVVIASFWMIAVISEFLNNLMESCNKL